MYLRGATTLHSNIITLPIFCWYIAEASASSGHAVRSHATFGCFRLRLLDAHGIANEENDRDISCKKELCRAIRDDHSVLCEYFLVHLTQKRLCIVLRMLVSFCCTHSDAYQCAAK